jgi:TolB-like protein/Tfp pilus assembly protein PilF
VSDPTTFAHSVSGIPSQRITDQLERMLASSNFAEAPMLSRLLRYLVAQTLAGNIGELKEYSVGVEVFDRGPSFDPRTDTIVRVQARRLRSRLEEYYKGVGQADPVRITLPKGHYVVRFDLFPTENTATNGALLELQSEVASQAVPKATERVRSWRKLLVGGFLLALVLCVALWIRSTQAPHVGTHPNLTAAVAPFTNASSDARQQYLADGVTEALTTALSDVTSLRVVPRRATKLLKNATKPIADAARELGADLLIDGSVASLGENVRVSARLIDLKSNETRWANTYDRPRAALPSLHLDIAQAVLEAVVGATTQEDRKRLSRAPTLKPEAYELLVKGRDSLNRPGEAALREALSTFSQALRLDPSLSSAHVGIADAWFGLSTWYVRPHDAMPHMKKAALRAVESDPELAEAHSALGTVSLYYDFDWQAAEKAFLKAISLDPNSAAAHRGYADYLLAHRRFDEAIAMGKRSVEIDPFSLPIRAGYLLTLATAGRNDEALVEAQRALDVEPRFSVALVARGLARSGRKEHAQAVRDVQQAVAMERTTTNLGFLANVQAAAGNRGAALKVLQELRRASTMRYVCAFEVGVAYSSFGDADEAFRWFEKAFAERADCMPLLAAEPWTEGIRDDPRFAALLRRLGLHSVIASQ